MRDVTEKDRIRRCIQETDPVNGETWQLRVEWDAEDGSRVEIASERMTSSSADSQIMKSRGRAGDVLFLSEAEADWLLVNLADVIHHERVGMGESHVPIPMHVLIGPQLLLERQALFKELASMVLTLRHSDGCMGTIHGAEMLLERLEGKDWREKL